MHPEYRRGEFTVSSDPARLDLDVIHHYLAEESYWASGISREVMERSLRHSLCFGLYHGQAQIGLARVVTDQATYAYLADVFVLAPYRGQGLGKWLISCVLQHPALQGLRRMMLATKDAHSLYAQFGFEPLRRPERHMERLAPDFYTVVR